VYDEPEQHEHAADGIQYRTLLDPEGLIVTAAEQADCNCPDVCERDHERD